jgi:hypothetical protein
MVEKQSKQSPTLMKSFLPVFISIGYLLLGECINMDKVYKKGGGEKGEANKSHENPVDDCYCCYYYYC